MNVAQRPGIRFALLVSLLAVLATASIAQTTDSIAGRWRTEIADPRGTTVMIMEFQLDPTSGRWSGTVRSSRAPQEFEELQNVSFADRTVRFHTITEIPGQNIQARTNFNLRLRPAGDELVGTMTISMPGMEREMPLTLTRIVERIGTERMRFQPARPFIGNWSAQPDRDDRERELVLEVLPDGARYLGTLTDTRLDQTVSLRDLVINDTENTISFNFRFEGAPFLSSFWGRYDDDRDRVRGSLSIGGRSQAISFDRTSPGPESLIDDLRTVRRPLPRKHETKFAATARGANWTPLYVMKENVRNINDITTRSFALDAGLRYYLLDYLALQGRVLRGGLGFDTNERNLGLFDPVDGPQGEGLSAPLTTDSYLKLDGYEFSIVAYLGQSIMPESKFNPYLIGVIGRTTWAVTDDGRDGNVMQIFEVPLEGTDWTFGGGLGTEYAISSRVGLEFEWVWAYTNTEDELKWSDVTYQWTRQHGFRFSLGAILWF
jgi:hypothetical protein